MSGRALILAAGRSRGSLAAARELSRAGWYVGVGTPDGGGMVSASRHVSARHRVARPRGSAHSFVDDVARAVDAGAYDVVFGGADDWMAALATYRAQVPCAVAHPGAEVVMAVLDKVELAARAEKAGLATPTTVVASDEVLDAWTGPVVVKCRSHWTPGQRHLHRVEARRYEHPEQARARVAEIRAGGLDAVLQRPVAGQLSALIGVFHEGRLHGRVHQRSPRLWPVPCGVSARAETIAVDEGLAAACERLLADLDWSGLVELQFLTAQDGEPHVIDFNGRFFGSMALANAARPGLVDAWGRLATGRPLPVLPDAEAGVRFAWTAGDLRRATVQRRGGLVRDVAGTLVWARGATSSVWAPDDPGPVLHLARHRLLAPVRSRRAAATDTDPE